MDTIGNVQGRYISRTLAVITIIVGVGVACDCSGVEHPAPRDWQVDDALDARQESGAFDAITGDLVTTPAPTILSQRAPASGQFPSVVQGTVTCLPAERAMVDDAYHDLNKVLSSESFKSKVLAAPFTETRGMSNQQVYDLAVSKSPVAVDFSMFTGTWKQNHLWHTMGYEDSMQPNVCFANRHFIRAKEVSASLILHETMHIIGFRHDHVKATSVPYTMNRIYDAVAAELGLGN